jgi:hypothetical protein
MSLRRVVSLFVGLMLSLAVAACGGGEAPQTVFAPLGYDYLRPLRLDVATLDVENRSMTRGDDVASLAPVPPAQALTQMAHDRIFPGGSAGRAVFVIQDASIRRHGDTLAGSLAVRLDVVAANGQPTAFAEARVARSSTTDEGDLRTRLYALTKQMMDDMNVEFEFQSRRALKASLQPDGDVPAAVSVQPLSGPGGTPGGGTSGTGAPGDVPPVAPGYGAPPGAGRAMSPPPGSLSLPSGYAPAAGGQDPRMNAPAGLPMPAASPYSSGVPQQAPSPYGSPQSAYGQPSYGQPPYGQDPYAPPGARSPGTAVPYAPPPGLQSGPLPLTQ